MRESNNGNTRVVLLEQAMLDYQRVEKAIAFLGSHYLDQPDLRSIARAAHVSEYHFQRLFTRWAGISPKRFLQYLTLEHAKTHLADSAVLETALDCGLSSPGRLHDLFISAEAVTPGEFKTRGAGLRIAYGFHPTPFGWCLIGTSPRGICWLSFCGELSRREMVAELSQHWRGATCAHNAEKTGPIAAQIFSALNAKRKSSLSLLLVGTNFQLKVWEALLRIPAGKVVSYHAIGEAIGLPSASRAIGNAVASNAIAYLVPCHRVIQKSGLVGGYRWGKNRKQAILGWEQARVAAQAG